MSCCSNPQDLGCILSCDAVTTNVSADCAGTFTLTYNYNGAVVTRSLMSNGSGGFLTIPGGTFPEGSLTTFSIVSSGGIEMGCYKVKVLPQQPNIYDETEPWGTISSSVVLTEDSPCAPAGGGAVWPVTGVITFNDINLLDNGTEITIGALYNTNVGIQTANYQALTAGTSISGNVITINDKSLIGGNTISYRVQITLAACGVSMNFRNYVACYAFLPTGVAVGNQLISNAI